MPRAGDAYLDGALPNTHNPLDRMQVNVPKTPFDAVAALEATLAAWADFVHDFLIEIIKDVTGIDLTSWETFISTLFSGGGIDLTGLVTFVNDLGQAIVDAFNGVGTVATGIIEGVWNAIAGILGIGNNAQGTANDAKREIGELKAQFLAGAGSSYSDNLTYSSSAYLPSPYVTYESGSGAGSYGPNGSSALGWQPSGNGNRCTIYSNPSMSLSVGKFGAAMIMESTTGRAGPVNYLGAMDSSGNGLGLGRSYNQVGLVTFSGGVPSALISPVSYVEAAGDSWEFYYGTTTYPRGMTIRLNGTDVSFDTDTGITLTPDIYAAIGGSATTWFFTQTSPARTGSFTFFDSSL